MTTDEYLIRIKNHLAFWQYIILNRKGDETYYKQCETLLMPVLNAILECKFENPNKRTANYPGIDLVDSKRHIGIQVTAEENIDKIKKTIDAVIANKEFAIEELYVFLLKGKNKNYSQVILDSTSNGLLNFRANKHIIDIKYLSSKLDYLSNDVSALIALYDHVSQVAPIKERDHEMSDLDALISTLYKNEALRPGPIDFRTLDIYSELFSFAASFNQQNSTTSIHGNIFHYLINSIQKSSSDNPLIVCGIQGSGKTTFLSVLYKALLLMGHSIPVYVNIQKYFRDLDETSEIFINLDNDLEQINQLLEKKRDSEIILIIDGADDSFRSNRELNIRMFEQIKNRFARKKKIIGLNINDNVFEELPQEDRFFEREGEIEVVLNSISTFSKNYDNYILLYAETKGQSAEQTRKMELHLLEQIKKFKMHRVDLFTLDILSQRSHIYDFTKGSASLSDFINKYCRSILKPNTLGNVAKMAFDYYINKKVTRETEITAKELLFTHPSIRDYLLAYIIIERLGTVDLDKKELDFVYTDHINNFCKEIMNSSNKKQEQVYTAISIYFDEVGYKAKAHFAYLLGRFTSPVIKDFAKNFLHNVLEKEYPNITTSFKTNKINGNLDAHKEKLLYYRSIFISLIYLGDHASDEWENANRQYLSILKKNGRWDSINRGFHIEYYGDLPFDPSTGPLQKEDQLKADFSNTYTKLYNKINDAILVHKGYSLIEVDVYTLCSLAQHRQADTTGCLDNEKRLGIIDIASAIVKSDLISQDLSEYVEFVADILKKGEKISFGSFLDELSNLKCYPRAGWVERGLENTEVIGAHIYNMMMLAWICLPAESYEEGYDKNKIIQIIFIHDIGEAKTMDKSKRKKTKADYAEEEKAVKQYALLNTYLHNGIDQIEELFYEFEHGNTINAQIARDFDKLENLQQLYRYHFMEGKTIDDFDIWERNLLQDVVTAQGKKVRDYIVSFYQPYRIGN